MAQSVEPETSTASLLHDFFSDRRVYRKATEDTHQLPEGDRRDRGFRGLAQMKRTIINKYSPFMKVNAGEGMIFPANDQPQAFRRNFDSTPGQEIGFAEIIRILDAHYLCQVWIQHPETTNLEGDIAVSPITPEQFRQLTIAAREGSFDMLEAILVRAQAWGGLLPRHLQLPRETDRVLEGMELGDEAGLRHSLLLRDMDHYMNSYAKVVWFWPVAHLIASAAQGGKVWSYSALKTFFQDHPEYRNTYTQWLYDFFANPNTTRPSYAELIIGFWGIIDGCNTKAPRFFWWVPELDTSEIYPAEA